jgi:hypothetical protein
VTLFWRSRPFAWDSASLLSRRVMAQTVALDFGASQSPFNRETGRGRLPEATLISRT